MPIRDVRRNSPTNVGAPTGVSAIAPRHVGAIANWVVGAPNGQNFFSEDLSTAILEMGDMERFKRYFDDDSWLEVGLPDVIPALTLPATNFWNGSLAKLPYRSGFNFSGKVLFY